MQTPCGPELHTGVGGILATMTLAEIEELKTLRHADFVGLPHEALVATIHDLSDRLLRFHPVGWRRDEEVGLGFAEDGEDLLYQRV